RRHTMFSRDWSSDVCSSDREGLHGEAELVAQLVQHVDAAEPGADADRVEVRGAGGAHGCLPWCRWGGRGQARYQAAIAAISASASGALPAMNGKTCCMPSTTESVTSTPAARARSASRVASDSSDSSAPALT